MKLNSFVASDPRACAPAPDTDKVWYNVTLECRASGATEDLNVTWEIKGLPKEWEQRRTLGLASNSCTLTVNLPLSHPHASLICVVSNQVDKKTVSLDLGKIWASGECNLPEGRSTFRAQIALRSGGSELYCPPCYLHYLPSSHFTQESRTHIQYIFAFKCLTYKLTSKSLAPEVKVVTF